MRNPAAIATIAILLASGSTANAQDSESDALNELLNTVQVHGPAPGRQAVVIVRPFDSSEADLGTGEEGGKPKQVEAAQQMLQDAPIFLAAAMVEEIAALDYFADVREDSGDPLPADAIVIEGRFTKLNPGSRAKRYLVGFGAGRQVMEISGHITTASGQVLVDFVQERISVMGGFGGNYQKKLKSGMELFGSDVAKFLDAWVAD